MDQLHEDMIDLDSRQEFTSEDEASGGVGLLEAEMEGGEETAPAHEESFYTDDPVRVYLREMGSVSLLTRQGEVDLARRMERGTKRVRKVLSRSPLVQRLAMALYEEIRRDRKRLDEAAEVGAPDAAAKDKKRDFAMRRFARAAKSYRELAEAVENLHATPERMVNVRARMQKQLPRMRVRLSQALRDVPFSAAQWHEFANAFKVEATEVAELENRLN